MRFLITTLQTYESEFYGAVGRELERRGHSVTHVTESRRSARELRGRGADAHCVLDVAAELGEPASLDDEVRRIEAAYPIPHLRDVYRTDWPLAGRSEEGAVRRTVAHVRALERIFDEAQPDVALPEVGNETIRIAAHLIAGARGIPALFMLHTIFPNPLRVYVDTLHAPIAPVDELRELTPGGARRGRGVPRVVHAAATPIREHRRVSVEPRRAKVFAEHVQRKLTRRPRQRLPPAVAAAAPERRRVDARPRWRGRSTTSVDAARPFVYFPLHVTDDYKITAGHPALRRPGVARRAGRGRAAAGPRPRAQGAPDVDRPQQHRPAAPAAQAAERPPRRAVHEHARADQRARRPSP